MNRIAVISMMKNEADIVESFVRHALQFADKIYVCDHKSTDRTREILESLKSEGLPIEISSFTRDELAMSKVINELMNKAFSENFDLVMPVDADEFPIDPNGNSQDLRKFLQNLDTDKYYRIYLWEHRFTDKDESRYALSRSIVRAKSFELGLPKIFVGKKFTQHHSVEIIHGNHNLNFINENYISYTLIDKIHYAHFSQRSSEQLMSKMITNHLNNRLMGTRYCIFPQLGVYNPKIDVLKHEVNLEGFESVDFSAYKDECINKFSGGGRRFYTKSLQSFKQSCRHSQSRSRKNFI